MSDEMRLEIINHAVRWTNNILAEVQNNHARVLKPKAKEALKTAITALGDCLLHISEGV